MLAAIERTVADRTEGQAVADEFFFARQIQAAMACARCDNDRPGLVAVALSDDRFDRAVTDTEYDAVLSWMLLLGLENGFTQDPSSADSDYIPLFDFEGL